jgi:hypothetical protein
MTTMNLWRLLATAGYVPDGNGERDNNDGENGDSMRGADTDGTGGMDPLPRTDDPPHHPGRPDRNDWDDDFLGNGMDGEPTYGFEQIEGIKLEDSQLRGVNARSAFFATLITSAEDTERHLDVDASDEVAGERVRNVDFDEEIIVLIESGFGSSSVHHEWRRVHDHGRGIHVHGYYAVPREQVTDITSKHSVLVVEKPSEAVDVAQVSLTVRPDRRVNFTTDQGVVVEENTGFGG